MKKKIDEVVDGIADHKPLAVEELTTATEGVPSEDQQHYIRVPARHNPKLARVIARVNGDQELWTLWQCANVNAIDRLGMTDHGWVHVQIVANIGLKLLRLLLEAGIQPGLVQNHGMVNEDAEVVVVLAALLHDLGMSVQREDHEQISPTLAAPKIKELLAGIYDVAEATIIRSETLHAILAHRWDARCLSIEAGVTKVADALDVAKGRSRLPFDTAAISIHAVSALSIEGISLSKGEQKPIRVEIAMNDAAGIFQVDELLKRKLQNSSIAPYVEVIAHVTGSTRTPLVTTYRL